MKNIIVHLNCHTHPIANALSDAVSNNYNIIKIINFKKEPIDETLLKKCDIYIYHNLDGEHWGEYNSNFFLSKLPINCLTINYPILRFNPFWPFNTKNAFKTHSNYLVKSELFPNGDKFLLSKLHEYKSTEEVVCDYLAQEVNGIINLDKEFVNILEWFDSPRNSKDIKVKQFILEHYKELRLFHTIDHISDFFLNYMIENIFKLVGIKKTRQYSSKFMISNNVPIHPSVISHFDLSFLDRNNLYLYNGKHMTAKEYYIQYILDIKRRNNYLS